MQAIAQSKRVQEKHLGIKVKGWGGHLKREMDGTVVRR
jgi:hypothetical protein